MASSIADESLARTGIDQAITHGIDLSNTVPTTAREARAARGHSRAYSSGAANVSSSSESLTGSEKRLPRPQSVSPIREVREDREDRRNGFMDKARSLFTLKKGDKQVNEMYRTQGSMKVTSSSSHSFTSRSGGSLASASSGSTSSVQMPGPEAVDAKLEKYFVSRHSFVLVWAALTPFRRTCGTSPNPSGTTCAK